MADPRIVYPQSTAKGIGATVAVIKPRALFSDTEAGYFIFLAAHDELVKFRNFMEKPAGPKVPTTYQRTGDIGRGWRLSDQRGFAVDVYNIMPYAKYVHGDNAGQHQQKDGWLAMDWPNMFAEFQKRKPVIRDAMQVALNAYVRRNNLGPGDA